MPQPVTRKSWPPPKRCSTVTPPCPWFAPSPQLRARATPLAIRRRTGSRASSSLRKLALSANGLSYRLNTPRISVASPSSRRTTKLAWVISAWLFSRNPSVSKRLALAMNCVGPVPPASTRTCCRL